MNKGRLFSPEFLHLKKSQPLGVGIASCARSWLQWSFTRLAGPQLVTCPLNRGCKARLQASSLSGLLQISPSPTRKSPGPPPRALVTPGELQTRLRGDKILLRVPSTAQGVGRSVQPTLLAPCPPQPSAPQCPGHSLPTNMSGAAAIKSPRAPDLSALSARPSAGRWLRGAGPASPSRALSCHCVVRSQG